MDIIFDVEGTLANIDHRLHHIKGTKNWMGFCEAMVDDTINKSMQYLYWKLASGDSRIIICSGRSDEYRGITEKWLDKNYILYDALYMRTAKDYRIDSIIKQELLQKMRKDGFDPKIAIDDRQQVVDMWRENGLLCLQCAKGDF